MKKVTKLSSANNDFIVEKLDQILEEIRSISSEVSKNSEKTQSIENDVSYIRQHLNILPKRDQVFAASLLSQWNAELGLSEIQRKHLGVVRDVIGFARGEVRI